VGIEKANATKRNTIKLGSNVFLVTERKADTVAGSNIRPTQSDNPNKDPETEFATDFVHLRILSFSPYAPMSVTTAKNAKLETGAEINVPLFINEGDKVKVDTEKGVYLERIKQ